MTEEWLYPISTISMGNWSGDHNDIDEVQDSEDEPDDATTVIENGSSGLSEATFELNNNGNPIGVISNVRVYWRGMRGGNSGPDARSILEINTTKEYGTSHELESSWVTYYDDWALNPDSGKGWTFDDMDNLISGISGQGGTGTREARVTAIWIVATYKSVTEGRGHVNDYRNDHTNIIHENPVALDHTPYVNNLISDLQVETFTDIEDFFNWNSDTNARELGYNDFADYYDDCYDENGDIITGKETTVSSYQGKWK